MAARPPIDTEAHADAAWLVSIDVPAPLTGATEDELVRHHLTTVGMVKDVAADPVAWNGVNLGVLARARITAALAVCAPPTAADRTAEFLRNTQERAIRPWKIGHDEGRERFEAFHTASLTRNAADRKASFVLAAKAALHSVEDVLAAQYLLYGDDADRAVYVDMLLSLELTQRVLLHNWRVAGGHGNAWLLSHGNAVDALCKLGLPMFPSTPETDHLNVQLLGFVRENSVHGGAGGDKFDRAAKMFRSKPSASPMANVTGGAPLLPTIVDPNTGQAWTDAALVQQGFDA